MKGKIHHASLESPRLKPIWDLLRGRSPERVSAWDLIQASRPTSLSAAISEIRECVEPLGWTIEHEYEGETEQGRRKSYYRATWTRPAEPQLNLFGKTG